MKRRIIEIDEARCNGCGLCAEACHEGAIAMVNGKAKLMRDDYCDGLGDCLPACPVDAIHFVEREAAAYDAKAVAAHIAQRAGGAQGTSGEVPHAVSPGPEKQGGAAAHTHAAHGGCPGAHAHAIARPAPEAGGAAQTAQQPQPTQSQLAQWPVQIKLAPVNAPYFEGARLLIAADCAAYARATFHSEFMQGHVTLIGCPKLDGVDYAEKLGAILQNNSIKSVSVVRMEVPCCGGIEDAVVRALSESGKMIPWQVYTLGTDGTLLAD